MQIKTLDGKSNDRCFGLLAGPAGIGKTTQMTTFPKKETLGISLEKGFLSIEGSGYAYGECDSYEEILDEVTNVKTKYPWCKNLFVDSLSEIYDILKKELDGKFSAKQNFQKHDQMNLQLFHLIRTAKKIEGVNIYFVCHTKEEKNGMTLEDNLCFDGKMPEDLKKQFDFVVHMKEVNMQGHSEPVLTFLTKAGIEGSKVAKKRVSPWLNIEIGDYEEPDLYKLSQKLLGKS